MEMMGMMVTMVMTVGSLATGNLTNGRDGMEEALREAMCKLLGALGLPIETMAGAQRLGLDRGTQALITKAKRRTNPLPYHGIVVALLC